MVDAATSVLTPDDQAIIELVPDTLRRGRQLLKWVRTRAVKEAQWFKLGETYSTADHYDGFFGEADIDGAKVPVMAAVQDLFFDAPRRSENQTAQDAADDAARYQSQIREFALKYYLRAAEQRRQREAPDGSFESLPMPLRLFSWAPRQNVGDDGFDFAQVYYRKLGGETGKFQRERQEELPDVRTVKGSESVPREYEWLTLRTSLLNAALTVPLGPAGAKLVRPVRENCYLAMGPDFVFDEPPADAQSAGLYGCGYTMIKYGKQDFPFVYGPGAFDVGLQLNEFRVEPDGTTRLRLTFVVNQPKKLMSIFGVDPLFTGITMANLMTLGGASKIFDISQDRVMRMILYTHSCMYYDVIAAALRIFRQASDWTDPATIPEWILDKKPEKAAAAAA